ncbi:filamentous hemagglutinin N-terminal domain-containing protein [Pseudoduganella sp. R-31]|uniref:two-partner secretion domain-containing protein n=1 Tax=Pseudoduganella sp. R-31 TaxID=3404060 RepID=UPI003CE97159
MRNKTILRSSRMRRDMAWPMLVAATLPVVAPMPAYGQAMPSGGVVGAGKISISTPNANSMVLRQDSQRAVVNWNSFSIGKGNTVTFAQPGAGAATLNVVKGSQSSEIAGSLKANGSVFLVNQNGIAITPTGMVDTRAGFVASTLGMSEDDFMAGRNVFKGKGGAVVNQGQIITGPGGNVALLGSSVSNEGVISAPLGKVALGAGEAATLDLSGDGYLQVMLPSDAVTADGQALVTNSGVIDAAGGTVMLKAETVRAALREAVNMPGTIRAQSVSGHDGAIVLEGGAAGAVKVSGTLDASAAPGAANGGRIDVGGQEVSLSGARLDASGNARGGLVRIGGAFQGGREQEAGSDDARRYTERFGAAAAGSAPANAARTSIDAASSIDVSARGAAGEGGTAVVWSDKATVMRGGIDARGAAAAGAVEVSSASTVQSVALGRIALGKGGKLLLDPQNIQVDDNAGGDPAGSVGYGDNPGGVTHLYSGDLTALLGGGTSISLKASQDITWNTFTSIVARAGAAPAGSLALAAGRSVSLNGIFGTADADWSITANDRAANGVVDSERGAGAASIELGGANFINSNGKLTLHLSDGAGNTNSEASGITLGGYSGNGLSATIAPGASWGGGIAPYITLTNNVNVAEDISLTGNLSVSASSVTLSGRHVDWTNETTAALRGEGKFKFVADGITSRIGSLNGGSATRLALGDGINAAVSKVYGDADPGADGLGIQLLHVTSGTASDALGDILASGSLATSGPGVTANAGTRTISLSGGAGLAFNNGLAGSYFIDMSPVSMPLTITRRSVTPVVGNHQGTYGTAAPVVTLDNVVNNDVLAPLATIDGGGQQALSAVGNGYAFSATTRAGAHAYQVIGLTGAAASNYELAPGSWAGSLAVAPKALTFVAFYPNQVYGDADSASSYVVLGGIVGNDSVSPVAGSILQGGGVAPAGRLKAGSYSYAAVGLAGSDAGNYIIAAEGNDPGAFTISPRVLNYSVGNVQTVYGTPASAGALSFNNVLAGDDLTAGPVGFDVGGARLSNSSATTNAGAYAQTITSLGGADAGSYTLAGSQVGGVFSIARKQLTWSGNASTQQYGSDLPTPSLVGVINGDQVSPVQSIASSTVTGSASPTGKPSVGFYSVRVGGLSGGGAANYELDPNGGQNNLVTVVPRELTYTGGTLNLTYGDGGTLPAFTFNGLLAGDSINTVPMIAGLGASQTIDAHAPAGSYAVNVLFRTSPQDNYKLADSGHTPGVLNIAKRSLTWNVGNGSSVYGAAPANQVTLNNVAAGDSLTPLLQALDGNGAPIALPGVGSYVAAVTGLGGSAASNYVFAATGNATGQMVITPKQLNVIINNALSVYGTLAVPSVTVEGLVGSDSFAVQTQVAISQNGSPVVLGARTPAGSYAMQVSAQVAANANYTVGATNGSATLTVQPKTLTYSGPVASYEYGARLFTGADFKNTLYGVLDGDDVSLPVLLSGSWTNPNARLPVGDYVLPILSYIGLNGRDKANYAVTDTGSRNGLITITPKALHYRTYFSDDRTTRTYGDTSPVWVFVDFTPAFPEDNVAINVGSLVGESRSSGGYLNVGTYATKPGGLRGLDSGNYVLATSGNTIAELTVIPRKVDASFTVRTQWGGLDMGKSLVYGSTGGAYLSFLRDQALAGDKMNLDANFQLPGGAAKSLPADAIPGTYYVGGALGGVDARNYYIPDASPTGLFGMIDVVPRPVSVVYPSLSKSTYGIAPDTKATLNGFHGDPRNVQVTGDLLDDKGIPQVVASRTPAGTYTFRPSGLSGTGTQHQYITQSGASWLDSQTGKVISVGPSSSEARFQVDKRSLDVSFGGPYDMVYGSNPGRATVTGWIAGDVPNWWNMFTTLASPTPGAVGRTFDVWNSGGTAGPGDRIDAGTYRSTVGLPADLARNYTLSKTDIGTIRIAQRQVSAIGAGTSVEYGDINGTFWLDRLAPTFSGVLSGEALAGKQSYYDASGKEVAYGRQTDAGTYQARVTSLQGLGRTNANNYVIDNVSSVAGKLVITPHAIALNAPEQANTVYGTSALFGNANDVLFRSDDVSFMLSGAGLTTQALTPGSASDRNLYLDQRVNVGDYNYQIQLTGAKAGNYVLTGRSSGKLSVAPKALNWTVSAGTGQYGFYKDCDGMSCSQLVQGVDLGKPVYPGALAGDQLDGKVIVLDLQGKPMTVDARTPVGTYFQVVTELTGASAKNYTLATSGNLPGTLTIKPLWLRYSTGSSVNVLDSYGEIGEHGTIKLETIGGVPMPNGESVDAITAIYVPQLNGMVPLDTVLPQGRYYYEAAGLVGANAGNYRLMPVAHGRFGVPSGVNTIGTYDVYSNASFGLNLVESRNLPVRPPSATIIDRDQTDLEKTWGEQNAPAPNPGRLVDGDGTVTDTELGPNRAGATVGAGTSADLGTSNGVSADAEASGVVTALASFGVTGVKLSTSAEGHVDITISSGPMDLTAGAQGAAEANLRLGRTGVTIGADATVGVYANAGVSGNLGGGVSGNVDVTTGTFAYAQTNYRYGLVGGVLTMTQGGMAGVGSSLGANGGLQYGLGSVGGGATLYTPGIVGGNISIGAGYSDGVINLSMDIGAAIGIGGIEFKFNLGIDVGAVASGFAPTVSNTERQPGLDQHGLSLKDDPAARYAYLSQNPEWNYGNRGSSDNNMFMYRYGELLKSTGQMVKNQQEWQSKMVDLLKTDPAKAVEFSRNKPDFWQQQFDVKYEAAKMGVTLKVVDGELKYATWNK